MTNKLRWDVILNFNIIVIIFIIININIIIIKEAVASIHKSLINKRFDQIWVVIHFSNQLGVIFDGQPDKSMTGN